MAEMFRLLSGAEKIEEQHLANWFPEDYVRLGSPYSTLLEMMVAIEKGYDFLKAFAFGSKTLPFIAALLTATGPVFLYGEHALLSDEQKALLQGCYGCTFTRCTGAPKDHGKDAVVIQISDESKDKISEHVDAVVDTQCMLHIIDTQKIPPADVTDSTGSRTEGVHTIRKRLGAALTTPDAIARLEGKPLQTKPDTTALDLHLKELAGCAEAGGEVLITVVGLASMGACIMASLELGNNDIDLVMCSTAYGGSSQQADILSKKSRSKAVHLQKHKFDIQGKAGDVLKGITMKLESMKSGPKKALTLVAIEYPTNPDMKDTDLAALLPVLQSYQKATGSKVLAILDVTFSPQSKAAAPLADIPVIVWTSLSKSVTGGYTTGGSLVANHHPLAQQVLRRAHFHMALMDTCSKNCQLRILNDMHAKCEERVQMAHENAKVAFKFLEESVLRRSGQSMAVNFVTAQQMKKGVTPATFSFNLPAPQGSNRAALSSLAQTFVDHLVSIYPEGIKPCVSFGQKNTYVYVTVPATSTQGVISEKDKAKQAVGGVQLVRFSFPPNMDMAAWNKAIDATVQKTYAGGVKTAAAAIDEKTAAATVRKSRARKWLLPGFVGLLVLCGRMARKGSSGHCCHR